MKSPRYERDTSLAEELARLDQPSLAPDSPRHQAYLTMYALERMTRACLLEQGQWYLLSHVEREEILTQLIHSLGRFDWSTLQLSEAARVLDDDLLGLIVHRIADGESLRFFEDLLYERFDAVVRYGASSDPGDAAALGATLSALRLPNYRRRRPPEHVHATRPV